MTPTRPTGRLRPALDGSLDGSGEGPAAGSDRLHTAIARDLGVAIVGGVYQPGDVLPTELASSEAMKVSRSAYREAIRILAAKGFVEARRKAGTRVSARENWNLLDPDVLSWYFTAEPSIDFIQNIFELRQIVEPSAAALAAQRRTVSDLGRMRRALTEMERYGLDREEGRVADRAFHDAVLAATRNAPLISLSSSIGAAVRWSTQFKTDRGKLPRDPMPEHWRVFEAIAAGGADAARAAMHDLINLALDDTRLSLKR